MNNQYRDQARRQRAAATYACHALRHLKSGHSLSGVVIDELIETIVTLVHENEATANALKAEQRKVRLLRNRGVWGGTSR